MASQRARANSDAEIIAAIREGNTATTNAIAEAIRGLGAIFARPAAPAVDPNLQLMQMFNMMKIAREAFGPVVAPKSASEQLGEIVQLMDATKQIRRTIGNSEKEPDLLSELAPKVLEVIQAGLMQRGGQAPAALPPPAQGATMGAPPAENPQPQPEGIEMDPKMYSEEQKPLAMAIGQLNLAASFGMETKEAAERVYESAPDDMLKMLRAADWFEKLAAFAPDMRQYEQWYRQVRGDVLEIMDEEASDAKAAANGAGTDAAPAPKAA